jgi:hypothetical protein
LLEKFAAEIVGDFVRDFVGMPNGDIAGEGKTIYSVVLDDTMIFFEFFLSSIG